MTVEKMKVLNAPYVTGPIWTTLSSTKQRQMAPLYLQPSPSALQATGGEPPVTTTATSASSMSLWTAPRERWSSFLN